MLCSHIALIESTRFVYMKQVKIQNNSIVIYAKSINSCDLFIYEMNYVRCVSKVRWLFGTFQNVAHWRNCIIIHFGMKLVSLYIVFVTWAAVGSDCKILRFKFYNKQIMLFQELKCIYNSKQNMRMHFQPIICLNHRIQYVWFSQMPKTKFDDSFGEVKRWRVFLDLLRSYCYVGSACSFSCFVIVQLIHLLLVWDVGAHCNRRICLWCFQFK